MTNFQKNVSNFMKAVGQSCPDSPTVPDNLTRVLRISLLIEEVLELAEASGVKVCLFNDDTPLSVNDFNYNIEGEVNLIEIADALADINYVSAGAACSYGLDLEPFEEEVCRSNDSKITNGFRRKDGKWQKGPDYSPANLSPILEKQFLKSDKNAI